MSHEKSKVLVTGATGFLGRNILKAIHAGGGEDFEIIAACRNPEKLPSFFRGEVRRGDLRDAAYRREIVQNVQAICHAGTWSSLWNHEQMEREAFFEPTLDLLDRARAAGAKRFLMSGTVVVAKRRRDGSPVRDDEPGSPTGFWPHLDRLVEIENRMRKSASPGMKLISMRLGHFIGPGNTMGILPALLPRLKTRLVPWLAGGRSRLPLISGEDLGRAFLAALRAPEKNLNDYESLNIVGNESPSMRDFISFISEASGAPRPLFSVPYSAGYAFGWAMEKLHPALPGQSPFLTRSIVHLAEDWNCPGEYAREKIGFQAKDDWRKTTAEALEELSESDASWLPLAQETR